MDNWKLWLIPFAIWGLVMAWNSGYQSGYQEGHQTAWEMSRPNVALIDGRLALQQHHFAAQAHLARQ